MPCYRIHVHRFIGLPTLHTGGVEIPALHEEHGVHGPDALLLRYPSRVATAGGLRKYDARKRAELLGTGAPCDDRPARQVTVPGGRSGVGTDPHHGATDRPAEAG